MLELAEASPSSAYQTLLSSITSTELQKIIFQVSHIDYRQRFGTKLEGWVPIDEQLCQVVDQLRTKGYNRTLVVELRLGKVGSDIEKYCFAKFLPKFREKGVVTIVANGDQILHSSTLHSMPQGVGGPQGGKKETG